MRRIFWIYLPLVLMLVAGLLPSLANSSTMFVIQPAVTLAAGDQLPVVFTANGTPFATVVVQAPSLTPTNTSTPTNTPTRTFTPTSTATLTPTSTPTVTSIYFPFIQFNFPPGTPTLIQQLPLLTVRVFDTARVPQNGVVVKVETCDANGIAACASYNTTSTVTTTGQFSTEGIAFHSINKDYWHRVTVGSQVIEFYLPTGQMSYYVEFVQ